MLILALGIAAIGYRMVQKAGAPVETQDRDKYGRAPGHAHYRHDHP